MKKLFTSVFALAAVLLANSSCSGDEWTEAPVSDNEIAVTFTAQLENAVATRAIGDGTTAKYLTFAVFKAGDNTMGSEVAALRQEVEVKADLTATVETRLVKGQTYNFAFWAQSESVANATEKGVGTYYNIADMANIQVLYTDLTANKEARDAFYAVRKNLTVNGPIAETITLKRPFAQVNVGTMIGSLAEATKAGSTIKQSKMTFSNVATKLDLYTGAATETGELACTLANIVESEPSDKAGDLKDVAGVDYEYLSMIYILVPDAAPGTGKQLVDCKLTLADNAGTTINAFDIPNVPVQRNWRTNIIGDILSSSVSFSIIIDPKFDNDHNYITNEELAYVLANGGTYTLKQDEEIVNRTDADGKEIPLHITSSVVINLNGHKLTYNGSDILFRVDNGGVLTFEGAGSVISADYIASANEGGKVVVSGSGEYQANTTCFQANGGEVYISGGTFEVEPYAEKDGTKTYKYTLNHIDAMKEAGLIEVTGGTFVNYNPAESASENPVMSFVPEGYGVVSKTTEEGDVLYTVVKAENVTTEAALKEKLAAGAPVISLTGEITLTEKLQITNDVVLMSVGRTRAIVSGKPMQVTAGNVTVKDVLFKNAQSGNESAIYVSQGNKNFTLDGCCFVDAKWDALQYTPTGSESITVKNCEFNSTGEVYRYLHLQIGGESASDAQVTITGNQFYAANNCKDSAVTIYGFKKAKMTIADNEVHGVAEINSNVIWISDGFDDNAMIYDGFTLK